VKIGGYVGKVAFIDLTKEKTYTESLKMSYAKVYLGGKGVAARYLLDYINPGVDPLSPENIFMV
jgi:aldehyde:ferredoxin oxidoreductase